jgi:hypothetical protein
MPWPYHFSCQSEHNEWRKREICARFDPYLNPNPNLPIPVPSDVRPTNAHQFLTHIVLSLGKYDTEIDALTNSTSRECFLKAGLIGNATDSESLQHYSNQLTRQYIVEQVVNYPISMDQVGVYIVTSKKVFDDAIRNNALSMSELPPFTMSTLRAVKTKENEAWWSNMKNSQLDAIYAILRNANSIPSRDAISRVTRESPLTWSPIEVIKKYERQSDESYEEQMYVIDLAVKQLNKYRSASDEGTCTYLKNTVIYGAPGTGKSYVAEVIVLYALSLGLHVITTALMGVQANVRGGIHLHEIFKLPTSDSNSNLTPFQGAQIALDRIMHNVALLHALRTVDVIYLDESGQVSAKYLSMMDIILRKVQGNSQTPFGGVHIVCTMDPSQLQPINMLPFLVSSFMLTCFMIVILRHSVRAHGDQEFQRLQELTRMDAQVLLSRPELKEEFFEKAGQLLTYVPDWDDDRIGPNMLRVFSRKLPAQQRLVQYREAVKSVLESNGIPFRRALSRDGQKTRGSSGDYMPANEE